jgi:hypothetical protein
LRRWCVANTNGDSDGYSDTDGNAYCDCYGYGYCHSNSHTDANRDVHADANSDANRSEALANTAAASNNTAAASVVGSDKWNSSCGNSRVTLASSPLKGGCLS